jgi:hypothetical protein
MIKLIVTASDELYSRLSALVRAEGQIPKRARDVLQGFEQAAQLGGSQAGTAKGDALAGIVVDMSLHAADTLLETLHNRQSTAGIPLLAVRCDGQTLPLALRRLCVRVLETDGNTLSKEQTMGEL